MLDEANLDAVIVETGADIHAEFCAKALEKKSKINGLCLKESVVITKEMAQSIVDGDLQWMIKSNLLESLSSIYKEM